MPLIIILAVLCLLKYLDVGFMIDISWWWLVGLAAFAFLWFEFLERMLGLDKRKDHAHYEKIQSERIKRTFQKDKSGKR